MNISAKANEGGYTLTLSGAPAKSVVEVRWQNTLSGVTSVDMSEVKADGTVVLGDVPGFGQHYVPTLRVLNDKNHIDLVTFAYTADDTDGSLHLVRSNEPIGEVKPKTEQPQPVNKPTPEASKG